MLNSLCQYLKEKESKKMSLLKRVINYLKNNRYLSKILIVIAFVVIMRALGFRITYNPNLEDNWEAISACGTWFCGCVVPVAVIILQHRINESEKKTSASNMALLEEVNKSRNITNETQNISDERYISSAEIYRYICIKMVASTTEIAAYFGVKPLSLKNQLENLWAVEEVITTVSLEDDPCNHIENCHWKKA